MNEQLGPFAPYQELLLGHKGDDLSEPKASSMINLSLRPNVVGPSFVNSGVRHAAYEHVFCYKHGESEYLLGTSPDWLSSGEVNRLVGMSQRDQLKHCGSLPLRTSTPMNVDVRQSVAKVFTLLERIKGASPGSVGV